MTSSSSCSSKDLPEGVICKNFTVKRPFRYVNENSDPSDKTDDKEKCPAGYSEVEYWSGSSGIESMKFSCKRSSSSKSTDDDSKVHSCPSGQVIESMSGTRYESTDGSRGSWWSIDKVNCVTSSSNLNKKKECNNSGADVAFFVISLITLAVIILIALIWLISSIVRSSSY